MLHFINEKNIYIYTNIGKYLLTAANNTLVILPQEVICDNIRSALKCKNVSVLIIKSRGWR